MGVYNALYAEVYAGGSWHNLNPLMKKADGSVAIVPVYEGQSWLCDLVDDLRDYAYSRGIPEDASEEVLAKFPGNLEDSTDLFFGETTWRQYYESCVFVVDFQCAVRNRVREDRPYRQQGYVLRDVIPAFECGEIEEIDYWLTSREYNELPEEEKREYAYYEWNNAFDEYGMRVELANRVGALYDWLVESSYSKDAAVSYRDLYEGTPRIRIIVEQSW